MTGRSDSQIQRDIVSHLRTAGLPIGVSVDNGVVTLDGAVMSDEEHQAVLDLIGIVEDVEQVVDNIEFMDIELSSIDLADADFDTDEGDDVTSDAMESVQEAVAYFPPTDPPIEPGEGADNMEVASGFQSTSLEDNEDELGEPVEDDELAQRVLRDLNQDSATTDLQLYVTALGGTVVLTGIVDDMTDADLAVEVASQTSGVERVIDRIVVGAEPDALPLRRRFHRIKEVKQPVKPNAAWQAAVIANRFRLHQLKEDAQQRLEHMEKDLADYTGEQADERTISNHEGDIGSEMAAAETLVIEINRVREQLQEIEEAFERMDEGTYGICIDTGEMIEPARLRANPLAVRTVEAQRRWEELDR